MVFVGNADAVNTLEMLLCAAGHEMFTEYTASRVLERARTAPPKVYLPDIDGNELARRLQAMPEAAVVVLIAVSGYGQEQDR